MWQDSQRQFFLSPSHVLSETLEEFKSTNKSGSVRFAQKVNKKVNNEHKIIFWENLGITKKRETLEKISMLNGGQIERFASMMAKQSLSSPSNRHELCGIILAIRISFSVIYAIIFIKQFRHRMIHKSSEHLGRK